MSSSSISTSSSSISTSSSSTSYAGTQLYTGNIDTSKINTTAPSDEFPIQFRICSGAGVTNSDLTDIFNEIGEDYGKLRVYDEFGARVYVEVQQWDSTAQNAWLWIKLPFITKVGAGTFFYVYYNSAFPIDTTYIGRTGTVAAQNVWPIWYKAVYHLAQTPGGAGSILDSTVNANNGTPLGSLTPLEDNNRGGMFYDFGVNGCVNCGASPTLDISAGELYTVEVIFEGFATTTGTRVVLSRYNDGVNDGWLVGHINQPIRSAGMIHTANGGTRIAVSNEGGLGNLVAQTAGLQTTTFIGGYATDTGGAVTSWGTALATAFPPGGQIPTMYIGRQDDAITPSYNTAEIYEVRFRTGTSGAYGKASIMYNGAQDNLIIWS